MPPVLVKTKKRGTFRKSLIVIVGKNVSKKAAQRNLLKRRIRAIVQKPIKNSNKDYLIIVKPEAKNLTFQELKQEVLKNLKHQESKHPKT